MTPGKKAASSHAFWPALYVADPPDSFHSQKSFLFFQEAKIQFVYLELKKCQILGSGRSKHNDYIFFDPIPNNQLENG